MLLGLGTPCQLLSLAGQEHGRTIPLPDIIGSVFAEWRLENKGITIDESPQITFDHGMVLNEEWIAR